MAQRQKPLFDVRMLILGPAADAAFKVIVLVVEHYLNRLS